MVVGLLWFMLLDMVFDASGSNKMVFRSKGNNGKGY
jgi:hypothetical protein